MPPPLARPTTSPLWRTFGFYRRHLGLLSFVTALALVVNVGMSIQQHLFGTALDELKDGTLIVVGEDGSDRSRLWFWVGVILAVAAVRALLAYVQVVCALLLGQRLLFDLRDRVLGAVQALDQAWHRRHGPGEIVTRATRDCDKVRDAVVIGTRQLLDVGCMMLGVLGLLWWYHPWLGLVPTLLSLIAIVMMLRLADHLVRLDRHADDAYDTLTQHLAETVAGIRVIKAFALERRRIADYHQRLGTFTGRAAHALGWSAVRLPVPQALMASAHGWVLTMGGWLAYQGAISIGDLVVALMVQTGLIFRMALVARAVRLFADARASAERLWELLDARSAIESGTAELPPGPLGAELEGVRVDAVGGAGPPILGDCGLQVPAGRITALVGATNSGKTTLAALLPRLHDPDAGRVSVVAGERRLDLRDLDLGALRRAIQVVPQDGFLFTGSVRHNLALAAPEADEAAMWQALRCADAEDFVRALPEGLATVIGERGVTLSGGQRQRLCLARAILARPRILVLDDATSAVDAETEERILARLREEFAGITVLIVASRLSSLLLADVVAVLEEGAIAITGRHQDLAARHHHYRELLCLDREGGERAP